MDKVDIIRKHIDSDDFYDLNGTEMLSKILIAMDEYAEQQLKNFNLHSVMPRISHFEDDNGVIHGAADDDAIRHKFDNGILKWYVDYGDGDIVYLKPVTYGA
ncbi:MAG: hypothetical protein ACOCVF_00015 [bacterium]